MSTQTFTVFCRQANDQGTTHIDTVEDPDIDAAMLHGRQQCLADWNHGTSAPLSLEDIHCLGVAAGNVSILHWEDLNP